MIDNEYANKEKEPIGGQATRSLESHEESLLQDESFSHEPISYESTPYESTIIYEKDTYETGEYEQTYGSFHPENESYPDQNSSRGIFSEDTLSGEISSIGIVPEEAQLGQADPMANDIAYVQSQQNMPSAIGADYYNVTDQEGWPIASLLILLDGAKQPVRAEVHVHAELSQTAYEDTVYQGYKLLQTNYGSSEPLPLRILQTYQHGESFDVPLSATRPQIRHSSPSQQWDWIWDWNWKPLALGLAGLLGIILLISGISRLFSGGEVSVAEVPTTPVATEIQNTTTEPIANAEETVNMPTNVQSGTSVNAHPGIAIGSRVRIRPGYMLSLRSEPSASLGDTLGYMENLQEATVIDGPVMTTGDKDVIVWWFVALDDRKAWAAANTSELTLLEPVE